MLLPQKILFGQSFHYLIYWCPHHSFILTIFYLVVVDSHTISFDDEMETMMETSS